MSKKEMIALVNKIEELKDENHRLLIGRDRLKSQILAANNENCGTAIKLDSGTQFKVFDRSTKRFGELSMIQMENNPMETMIDIIKEEAHIAVSENTKQGGL